MKYLALLAIPLLTLMPLVDSSHAQSSGDNGSNMITGSQIPDSLAWSSFFRHVERALNAEATNPEMIKGILHTTNLSEIDQGVLKGVCIEWAIDNGAIQAAHHQAVVDGTETGATVKNTMQKTANLSLAKAAELQAQLSPSGWKILYAEIQRHKNAIHANKGAF
jgi:hypothetical protein